MTEKNFLAAFAEQVLNTDKNISLEMKLADLEEWDSLSFVSFIALAKENSGGKITRAEISAAETVADLFNLVK